MVKKTGLLKKEYFCRKSGWSLVLFLLMSLRGTIFSAEFEPDRFTLLLAHFNQIPYKADYAMGWDEFSGSGANLVEGYFGQAVDLREVQYQENFLTKSESVTPYFGSWGFWPKGNINYHQGTIEFWFKVAAPNTKLGSYGQALFFFHYRHALRPTTKPDGSKEFYLPDVNLTSRQMIWNLYTLNREKLKGSVSFNPGLNPEHWHHCAITWSPNEMVFYIDGRSVASHDLTGKFGVAWAGQPHGPISMSGIVLDEFRISSIVRYPDQFEPAWHEGNRPAYAFPGVPDIKLFPGRVEEPYLPGPIEIPREITPVKATFGELNLVFDRKSGYLTNIEVGGKGVSEGDAGGLLLWKGVERNYLKPVEASNWQVQPGSLSFSQKFEGLQVSHKLEGEGQKGIKWVVNLESTRGEHWLEILMDLPLPLKEVKEYFDSSWVQRKLFLPRRRDEYVSSLPFVAAADSKRFWGIGIDAHTGLSSLISEWIPKGKTGVIRQGTRIVLSSGEKITLEYHLLTGSAEFGVEDAIAAYHSLFPDLYYQVPTVPIYSYLPVDNYFDYLCYPDLTRMCYIGCQWGHGPGHGKGDEWGTPKYWNNPDYKGRVDYEYVSKLEKLWGSLEGLREQILKRNKYSYYYFYTLRRSHYLPNMPQVFIAEDLWPGYEPVDDPLIASQYYLPGNYIVNEFRTPLGRHFQEQTTKIMEHIARYSPGFINDMCQTSAYRHVDEIARDKTPFAQRAFSADRGIYLVGAFGHVDRYKTINNFTDDRGFRQSIWSDGGVVSYMLSAYSAANAIESAEIFIGYTGSDALYKAGRYLLGEKPFAVLGNIGDDYLGYYFKPDDFTPRTLRDYYRYSFRQVMLYSIKQGIYLSPVSYLQGKQWMIEHNPILIESVVLGRKIVAGARVQVSLWSRRSGEGMNSFLVVGNEKPKPVTCNITLVNSYFGEGVPLFGAYFGGETNHRINAEGTTELENITFSPRSLAAFKIVGQLSGVQSGRVKVNFNGDGLTMKVNLVVEISGPGELELNPFQPMYRISNLSVNGKSAAIPLKEGIKLAAGESEVVVEYQNTILDFKAKDWQKVELIKDGQTNFCLVCETQPGFEQGTGMQLNYFLKQYNEEYGESGKLQEAVFYQSVKEVPKSFDSWWKIILKPGAEEAKGGRVRINSSEQTIVIEGKTQGDLRRAMFVFMRLVDRKYPHIGRFYALKKWAIGKFEKKLGEQTIDPGKEVESWEMWLKRKETKEFYSQFSDKNFLKKPLLEENLENLYEGDNMDFAGKYILRFSPYIFEPTFSDTYVYGYSGPAFFEE